jgi:hypothetical protein
VIDKVRCRLCHVPTVAGRADAAALAGEGHDEPPCGTTCRPRGRSRSRGARTRDSRGVLPRHIPARAARRLPARRASARGSRR